MPDLDLTATSVDLTRAICDVPSVSDDETVLADAIHLALAEHGHLDLHRDGDTIVARTHLGRDRRVVIAGHIDTVPINQNVPTRDIEIDGEPFIWGRGTVDMKAGVAVQLKLAAELGGRGELAVSVEAGEELFATRRAFHGAMAARGEVLIEDVAVPRSALADMFDELERIGAQFDVDIATVAHAGDGNLHPNFTFQSQGFDAAGEPIVPDEVWAAADAMFTAALRLGGTLTGEHGVGLLKRRWLRTEIGDVSFELQREIKRVFDPRGILNPGKVY